MLSSDELLNLKVNSCNFTLSSCSCYIFINNLSHMYGVCTKGKPPQGFFSVLMFWNFIREPFFSHYRFFRVSSTVWNKTFILQLFSWVDKKARKSEAKWQHLWLSKWLVTSWALWKVSREQKDKLWCLALIVSYSSIFYLKCGLIWLKVLFRLTVFLMNVRVF